MGAGPSLIPRGSAWPGGLRISVLHGVRGRTRGRRGGAAWRQEHPILAQTAGQAW